MLYLGEIYFSIAISLVIYLYYKLTFWKRQQIPNLITYSFKAFCNVIHSADLDCINIYGKLIGFVSNK